MAEAARKLVGLDSMPEVAALRESVPEVVALREAERYEEAKAAADAALKSGKLDVLATFYCRTTIAVALAREKRGPSGLRECLEMYALALEAPPARYRRFGDDLLLLDLMTATTSTDGLRTEQTGGDTTSGIGKYKSVTEYLADADPTLTDIFESTRAFLRALGDDVQERTLKNYFAFTRLKNFACIEIKPSARKVLVYLKVDPTAIELQPGFTRDVSKIGHYGTGDLEVTLSATEDVERAKPLFEQSYQAS